MAYQFLYLLLTLIIFRFKFYTAWSLGMLGMHASGITYKKAPKDPLGEHGTWDNIKVSDIMTFEFDPVMKNKVDAWNMSVQNALKLYVYEKMYTPSNKVTEK